MHKPPVWLLLSLALVTGLLPACSSSGVVTSMSTTAIPPTDTEPAPTNTVAPSTETPSTTPTPEFDAANLSPTAKEILDFFPLSPGTVRTYQASIDSSTGPETVDHWEGPITAEVTGATLEEGAPIFRVEWSGHPDITSPEIGLRYYVILDTGIYEKGSLDAALNLVHAENPAYPPYMTWPLEVGKEWNQPLDRTWPGWFILAQESIEVPAGLFESCIKTAISTNPDHAFRWFCPRVGLVRYEYHHHGSILDETWELSSFTLSSP